MKKISLAIAFLFTGILCFSQSIFLDVENLVEDKPEGQPVLAFSFGMSNTGSGSVGTGAGSGRVNLQDLSISAEVGTISASLQKAVATGTSFPVVRLKFYNTTKKLYYQITLEEVSVSSYQIGASCGLTPCNSISENYSLSFRKIKVENFTANNSFSFDVATNSQF